MGIFNKIFAELAGQEAKPKRLMIDATHLKAHRTAGSLQKRGSSPPYWADQRWGELEAARVCDGLGRPLVMLLSEGQMSDFKWAALKLPAVPKARELLGDKGYDADKFRAALADR